MMFRKPMRLEKWIAFDGGIGLDVAEAVEDAAEDSGTDAGSLVDEAPAHDAESAEESADLVPDSISLLSGIMPLSSSDSNTIEIEFDSSHPGPEAELELPIGFDIPSGNGTDTLLPFWNDFDVDFDLESGYDVRYLFFEISNPDNGTFSIYDRDALTTNWTYYRHKFNLQIGQHIAVSSGTYANGTTQVFIGTVQSWGVYHASPVLMLDTYAKADGETGLRVGVAATDGNSPSRIIETFFRSLAFTPNAAGETAGGSYSVSVYYKTHNGLYTDDHIFNDNSGSVFNETENPPKVVLDDATKECDSDGNVVGGGVTPPPDPPGPPDPTDPTDPDPVDPIDPVDPADPDPDEPDDPNPGDFDDIDDDGPGGELPVDPEPILPPSLTPGDPGGSDSGAGGGLDMGDGSSSDSAGDGDASGDEGGQDDLVYIYRREDEARGEENVGVAVDKTSAAGPMETVGVIEEKIAESSAAAAALELARDLESAYNAVREDRVNLENALDLLRAEYLGREGAEWGELRDSLRQLFESGNRELEAVSRVLAQMRDRMDEFRNYPVDRRDGMISESIRELVDSASRRSGETSALSEALNAVSAALRESRLAGRQLPNHGELQGIYDTAYNAALSKWSTLAMKNDPMGKELAQHAASSEEGPAEQN